MEPNLDTSNECSFDTDVRKLVDKYSQDGLLSAGEIVAVLTFIAHAVMHEAMKECEND
jgi:hypothetical protein